MATPPNQSKIFKQRTQNTILNILIIPHSEEFGDFSLSIWSTTPHNAMYSSLPHNPIVVVSKHPTPV